MSGKKLEVSGLNRTPEILADFSPYQKAEQEFISASSGVDEQIKTIKGLVDSIVDPKQKSVLLEALDSLQKTRIEELRAMSIMNQTLISPKNDEYLNYIKIFRNTNIGMGFADNKSKTFIVLNKALCKILEIDGNDYVGIDYPTFWNQFIADKEVFDKLKKEFREKGEVNGGIMPIITPKGTNKWIRIYSASAEGDREIFTILDITEREIERLGQLKAMHMLQHDIRGPLGSAEKLLDTTFNYDKATKLTDDEKYVISEIRKALIRTIKVANCYLDFARMEKGLYVPKYEEINLTNTIKGVYASVEKELYKFDKFEFVDEYGNAIDFKKDIFLDVESTYINIFLFNLLKNAVEGSSDGKKVTIRIRENEKSVMLEVNNDKEMAESAKKNVFRKKFVETTKSDGNGIGTYSMKLIVDMHGGIITFSSTLEAGTTMYVTLPKKATK